MATSLNKEAFVSLMDRFKRQPTDVVGIDVGTTAIKAVRMRSNSGELTLTGADILPPLTTPSNGDGDQDGVLTGPVLDIPVRLRARLASLTFTARSAVVKLLSFPGSFDASTEERIVKNLGLDDPDRYRISYNIVSRGHGRSESRVLTVAWPEEDAAGGPSLIPTGFPAPHSLEVSGLATLTTFLYTRDESFSKAAVGLINFGATTTTYALFNRGILTLIRRFGFGTETLLQRVQESLGVDHETAQGILTDGSFDISQAVSEAMETLVKQLMVSRDFVERRENCQVSQIYVSGGMAQSHDTLSELHSNMEVDVNTWSPLEGITIAKDAIPEALEGREWILSAAIGAALATLEESS